MRVLLTGATGFVGRALVLRLQRDGHRVVAWVRSPDDARSVLGAEVDLVATGAGEQALAGALAEVDAVINLAGERVLPGRWTAARKRTLVDSRVDVTELLVRAMAASPRRPRVLISASGTGYYGDRGDDVVDETAAPGHDFLAELSTRWEAAAEGATALGVRVVRCRIAAVLGRGGGMLDQLVPLFSTGLGGVLGSGRQVMPWIHLTDLTDAIVYLLGDEGARGAFNMAAPETVSNRVFTRSLGRALHRPTFTKAPAIALKLALGEASAALLTGQRAAPRALIARGYQFRFGALDAALADLFGRTVNAEQIHIKPLKRGDAPQSTYLERRTPRYVLSSRVVLDETIERVFDFFSRAENLGVMTPPEMGFHIVGTSGAMAQGTTIDYSVRLGPLRMRWRTLIETWQPGRLFVDSQTRGPYRAWWHEHRFSPDGTHTVMEDRVYYAPPLGLLGRLANALFVAPTLRHIFRYRGDAIRLRFGEVSAPSRA